MIGAYEGNTVSINKYCINSNVDINKYVDINKDVNVYVFVYVYITCAEER
jgi:hypothetical protein